MVARRAHNPKVVGSNPAPATKRLGYRQVVRHMVLVHALVGSNPSTPATTLSRFFMKDVDIDKIAIDLSLSLEISQSMLEEWRILPLYEELNVIHIGILKEHGFPNNLKVYFHKEIQEHFISKTVYDKYLSIIKQNRSLGFILSQVKADITNYTSHLKTSHSNITILLEIIFKTAVLKKASDIHIEPLENRYHLRFRIDGDLELVYEFDADIVKALLVKIKILSSLDISKLTPQDGGFSYDIEDKNYDFRVATISTNFGESMVIRILYNTLGSLKIDTLGFCNKQTQKIISKLKSASGLILVTGSTGSGKSTTLYSFLNYIKNINTKIITVEDPIEYKIQQAQQIQIDFNDQNSYDEVLKNILRLDPDILMIGEIRDTNSLETAIRSALTGHLVLSTLHTNDAIDTIARLKDMGVQDYLLASTISLVISQRLVKTLCNHRKQEYKPNKMILDKFSYAIDKDASFYQPKGCEKCSWSGYSGRTIISEILEFNEQIQSVFKNSHNKYEISKLLEQKGYKTILYDALKKSAKGIIFLNDIL